MTSRSLEIDAGNGEVFTVERLSECEWQSVFPERLADKSDVHYSEESAWRYVHGHINLERSNTDRTPRTFEIISEAIVTHRHVVEANSFEEALVLWCDGGAKLEQEDILSQSDTKVIDRNTGAWRFFPPEKD